MQGASFKYKKPEDSPQAEFYGGKQGIAVFACLFLMLTVQIYKVVKVSTILYYAQARGQIHLVLEHWDILRCLKSCFQMSLLFSTI